VKNTPPQRVSLSRFVAASTDGCVESAASLRQHAARSMVLTALLLFGLVWAPRALAVSPCCAVTSIAKDGLITARETHGTRTFQFHAADPALRSGMRIGAPVYANFNTKQVSLDGKRSCCTMLRISTAATQPVRQPSVSGSSSAKVPQSQVPPDEDAQDDGEPIEKPKPRRVPRLNFSGMRAGSNGTRMKDYPQAQQMMNDVIKAIMNKEINVALIGGEKYKVNNCLGIKASAGTFRMKLASPNLRIEDTGVRLTFRIDRVSMNALKIRTRPNSGNPLKLCHWSKKLTVGGAASNVTYEYRFDPILDLQQCKLGSMGQVKSHFEIGNLNLKPLQNDLDRVAKNMVEDAMNYVGELNVLDRVIAGVNGFLAAKCHK
jgi:hypothetical protein